VSDQINIGMEMYDYKRASVFQSAVCAFLVGLRSNEEELAQLNKIFI